MGRSLCWRKTQTVAQCSNVQLKGKTSRTIWIGHMVPLCLPNGKIRHSLFVHARKMQALEGVLSCKES